MRLLVRRVESASVEVAGSVTGQINHGLLVYIGIEKMDQVADLEWGSKKVLGLRIFDDHEGKMNLPIIDEMGILVVSQFTLCGNLKKGFRPSFNKAAPPSIAISLYEKFLEILGNSFCGDLETGEFGAHMNIEIKEDGPVTIWLDSQNKSY
ncbi:MAG: D-tyrosyl-tRNA(Tyr) deacylase [Opitutae bacterium]|nr:D-tyrosyl-tRNA(Tyr) deacylase [Opitutae bacterium]HAD21457.1 D-tyrosyl-tRNA(Tyr) deacylase [Opitutae bacterium]